MRKKKSSYLLKISIIILIIITLPLFLCIFGVDQVEAQSVTGGPITIWGQVYKSDGTPIGPEYDGTYAAVIIDHANQRTTHYDDTGGLESGIYTVTIPEGDWSQGDVYWVMIDGTPWDDLKEHRTEGIKLTSEQEITQSGTDNWILSGPSEERRDVITLAEEPDEPENYEPLISIIFAIIILITGILFLVVLSRQKVNVVIMEKKDYGVHRKSGKSGMYGYTCGYGHPKKPDVIGEIFGTPAKVVVDSKQTVSVQKIIRLKNGEYNWYKPKLIFRGPPNRIDSADEIDKLWFLNGGIELEKGESVQHAVRLNAIKRVGIYVLPFVILELMLGVISEFELVSSFTVPPWSGSTFLLTLTILIIGVLIPFWIYWRAVKVKRIATPLIEMPEIVADEKTKSKQEGRPLIAQSVQAAHGVLGGVVEDYPITPQRYLPPANLSAPVGGESSKPSPAPSAAPSAAPSPTPSPQPSAQPGAVGGAGLGDSGTQDQKSDIASTSSIAQPVTKK